MRIVWTRRSFGVVLHAEQRQRFVPEALVRVIVQIQVRDLHVARWQRFGIDAEAVILRSDLDLLGEQIFHRMIRAVMAELELERLAAEREAAELVTRGKFRTPELCPATGECFRLRTSQAPDHQARSTGTRRRRAMPEHLPQESAPARPPLRTRDRLTVAEYFA